MLGYLKGLKKSVFIMFLFAELKKLAIFAVRFTGVHISIEINVGCYQSAGEVGEWLKPPVC